METIENEMTMEEKMQTFLLCLYHFLILKNQDDVPKMPWLLHVGRREDVLQVMQLDDSDELVVKALRRL